MCGLCAGHAHVQTLPMPTRVYFLLEAHKQIPTKEVEENTDIYLKIFCPSLKMKILRVFHHV